MDDQQYDPDFFDWGQGPAGIDMDDIGPDIVQEAVQAALDAHEQAFGWRYLKRADVKESAGRLYRVPFYMPKEKREFFEENFPGYTFVWDGARGHHDHPAAHLCTELNELAMVEGLVSSGEQWIDLFGNGGRDRKYKRNCLNMYAYNTPRDYLRYQHTGITDIPFDMEALCNPEDRLGKINHVTVTHALYYLSMDMIGRIVNTSGSRKLHALVHRHKDTRGELNAGEQQYMVDTKGVVTQVNVATGMSYTHPTLEPLFHQQSARTPSGGVAWTINAAGGDSYIIEFVGCPNEMCDVYRDITYFKEKSWEVIEYKALTVCKLLHWTWMTATTKSGTVQIQDTDLLTKIRRYVAGKQRSPRLKTETMNYARRLCNKADIIAIHGGGAHEIPVGSMSDYVEVGFYMDVQSELDVAASFHRENSVMVSALNQYYENGKLPKDFVAPTRAAIMSASALTSLATHVIDTARTVEKAHRRNVQYMF